MKIPSIPIFDPITFIESAILHIKMFSYEENDNLCILLQFFIAGSCENGKYAERGKNSVLQNVFHVLSFFTAVFCIKIGKSLRISHIVLHKNQKKN